MPTTPLNAHLVTGGLSAHAPVLSPDGRWTVHTVLRADDDGPPTSSLMFVASDGTGTPRPLLADGFDAHTPRGHPDSRHVHFLSEHTDTGERGTTRLHRIDVDGSGHRILTGPEVRVVDHLPLPGARTTALVIAEPDTRDPHAPRVWGRDEPRHRLALLHDDALEPLPVLDLGERHVLEMAAHPDGTALAVITRPSPERDPVHPRWELCLVDPRDGSVKEPIELGWESHSPVWWHDGRHRHLAHLAMDPGPDGGQAVFDLCVDRPGATHDNLTRGMDRCPVELTQVDQGPPLALFAHGLDTEIHRLDPITGRFTLLRRAPGLLRELTASASGERVAAIVDGPHRPGEVHAGPAEGPFTRLTRLRPELDRYRWGRRERLSYRAEDGLALDGILVTPVGADPDEGPFPLVTWVHGGPYGRHADHFHLSPYVPAQWLAHFGYATFLPNPRGGEGRGRAFAEHVVGALGAGEWSDIDQGIDLLVARGVADPERLGIGGWSHGGTMAAWAVGRTDRFAAAIVGAGVSDWGMLAATGEYGAAEAGLSGSVGWEGPGPHPHDAVGPISHASRIRTPVLILHGEQDTNVPLGQAVYLHRALRHFGGENEFVTYPGEGHGLARRSNRIDMLDRTRAWFDRHLRPRG
ncbi:S9 family peptidase [Nocardiopsis alba]|uniref:S9 family peptidase n=1 Tax=Nocardiopsis alba TaxID=53437 RepID=UPI0033A471C8